MRIFLCVSRMSPGWYRPFGGPFWDRKFCPQNPPRVVMGTQFSLKNGYPKIQSSFYKVSIGNFPASSFPDQATKEKDSFLLSIG